MHPTTALFTEFSFTSSDLARSPAAGPRCLRAHAQQAPRYQSALKSHWNQRMSATSMPVAACIPATSSRRRTARTAIARCPALLVHLDLHLDVEVDA
eukprot:9312096-Heterocapsa_arctica.AAC.1